MSKRILRTMVDGEFKTPEQMDASSDAVRKLISKGFVIRRPAMYQITDAGRELANWKSVRDEKTLKRDRERKFVSRRASGSKPCPTRTLSITHIQSALEKRTPLESAWGGANG